VNAKVWDWLPLTFFRFKSLTADVTETIEVTVDSEVTTALYPDKGRYRTNSNTLSSQGEED
jgi:hypothetical protein